jgi:hypothetical protein
MGCCKYCCGITVLLVAMLLAPMLMYSATVVAVDDVKTWGLKGPGLSSLTPNMRGVYYLSGNQSPSKCNATEMENKKLCRGKWKRSPAMGFDTSYCRYDAAAGKISCPGGSPWFLFDKKLAKIAPLIPVFRLNYAIDKMDPEFASGKADAFEGAMKLKILGISITTWARPFVGKTEYRVTMEDTGDGSRVTRYTWWNAPNTPQPKSSADPEWTYELKRFLDEHGNVDKNVIAEIKEVYGDKIVVLQPAFSALSALGGLLSIFTVDWRFMPM